MRKYIVVVRDFNPHCRQPYDTYLIALDMYYASPIVELDIEDDYDAALDEFVEKYEKHFSHFRHINLELIPA